MATRPTFDRRAPAGFGYDRLSLDQKLWLATAECIGGELQPAPAMLVRICLKQGIVFQVSGAGWRLTDAGADLWREMWEADESAGCPGLSARPPQIRGIEVEPTASVQERALPEQALMACATEACSGASREMMPSLWP